MFNCYFLGIPKDYWEYLIPLLIPVLIFALGLLLAFLVGRTKEKKRLTAIKHQFETWIQLSEEGIEKQIASYRKMAIGVLNMNSAAGSTLVAIPQNLESILHTHKTDLLKIYLNSVQGDKKANQQLIFELISLIEYHHLIHNQSLENYGYFVDKLSGFKERWNNKLGIFNKIKATLVSIPEEIMQINPHLIELNNIYNVWSKQEGQMKITVTKEILLEPLQKYFQEVYRNEPTNPVANEILPSVQGLIFETKVFEYSIRRHFFTWFNTYKRNMSTNFEELKEKNEASRSVKLKRWWNI